MKCKKCGGELVISNGIYICDSCGSQYSVSDYYEDIEACICYVENDDAGRRTKDSVIAQDIYQKLESNKIKSFYARVSADGLLGEQYERACNAAVVAAKTVIILGTNNANFVSLINKYSDFYKGKVIIPVYADMNPYDIPKSISAIQALDYNKVGSEIDLINSILAALGREKEINYVDLTKKSKKKKRIIIISVAISVIILIALGCLLFATQLQSGETTDTTPTEDPRQSQYSEAITYIEDGKLADAIKILSGLGDYKDSNKQLQNIYEKYAGYYKSDDAGLILHLQVQSGNSATLEVTKNVEGKQIKISESAQFESCILKCDFNDSENNQGQLNITLNNSAISLTIKTKTIANDALNMGDTDASFALDKKSDKPFTEKLDAETILGFIKSKTTLGELKQRGFEVTFVAPLYKNEESSKYKINNTDVGLAIFSFDITKTDEYTGNSETTVDDPIVFGVSAPASILIPDYVGKDNIAFVEDDILYVPDGELSQYSHVIDLGIPEIKEKATISNDSVVCCVCKNTIGEKHFNELVNFYCNSNSTGENSDSSEGDLVWLDVGEIVYENPYPRSGMTGAIETATNYTIVEKTYDEYGNYWGKLKSGLGWVYLSRTFNENKPSNEDKTSSQSFNSYLVWLSEGEKVHAEPTPNSGVTFVIDESTKYTIVAESYDEYGDVWGELKSGIGWVNLSQLV